MQSKRTEPRTNKEGNRRSKETKYKVNKKLFNTGFALTLIMIAALIYTDGFSVLFRTWEISCPEGNFPCNMHYTNGTPLILQPGETHKINDHDTPLIPIINYTSLTMLTLIFITNHLLYNRHYKYTKKKIEKILIKEFEYWFRPIIWIIKKIDKYTVKDDDEKEPLIDEETYNEIIKEAKEKD